MSDRDLVFLLVIVFALIMTLFLFFDAIGFYQKGYEVYEASRSAACTSKFFNLTVV